MIKNVLIDIGGIGIYGLISLIIFFAFFLVMLAWAFGLTKRYLHTMSDLPLEDDNTPMIDSGDER